MDKYLLTFVLALLGFCQSIVLSDDFMPPGEAYISSVWRADSGVGTYQNPILHADYSDPDIIRVGDDYFMTASSFNCTPGLPILHSKDMVNWNIVNHAIEKLPCPDEVNVYDAPQHGKGVWAPSFRYHDNLFYIYWGDPDYGVYMVQTDNVFGRWSEPVLVLPGKGIIDPSPLWDDDGTVWLVTAWAASRAGVNSILTVWPMNETGSKVIGEGRHVYDGHDGNYTIEGPKFYKKDGYYYILAPAGGVKQGWQLALRSKGVYGPYEAKKVLAQGNTAINGPHQGGLVDTATGQWWFMHFQDKGAYGRILHLQPVRWINGWPVMGKDSDGDSCGEPVIKHAKPNVQAQWVTCSPLESDEFYHGQYGPQWQWAANYKITWWVPIIDREFLRLLAYPRSKQGDQLWDVPNLLMQKFPAPAFTATTRCKLNIEFDKWQGKSAGMVVMGSDYSYLAISRDESGIYYLKQIMCKSANKGGTEETLKTIELSGNVVYLRVIVDAPDASYSFSYSEDGKEFIPVGITLQAKPELWIGSKVGIFCSSEAGTKTGGHADFDFFKIEPNNIEVSVHTETGSKVVRR